jgi:hypothetical protein
MSTSPTSCPSPRSTRLSTCFRPAVVYDVSFTCLKSRNGVVKVRRSKLTFLSQLNVAPASGELTRSSLPYLRKKGLVPILKEQFSE